MTGLAWWLLVVAVVDLFRARRDASTLVGRALLGAAGAVGVLVGAVSAHPHGALGWLAWVLGALVLVGWVAGSGLALSDTPHVLGAAVAFGALGAGVVTLGLAGGRTGELGWLESLLSGSVLGAGDPQRDLIALAVLLVQISTANIAIRMLLDLVGVPAQDNEKSLRGGRLLGPMERLVIVGLGIAGSLTGATVVVAAKALLRFPELRGSSAGESSGASDVTEYFLIGSFASWIVAFGGIALASV